MTIALLILGMGAGVIVGFCGWMCWELGWLAEKRHALPALRRNAIQPARNVIQVVPTEIKVIDR